MAIVSLGELRSRVLERANMVGSSFVSSDEVRAIILGELGALNDLVVGAYDDQRTTSLEFTIPAGTTSWTLNAAIYKVRRLDKVDGSETSELPRFDWNSPQDIGSTRYRLVGSTIQFSGEAGGTYRVWYVPDSWSLVSDGDTLDLPYSWLEYVIAGSAARLLAKEESDPSIQLGLQQQAKQRIESAAPSRDASGPERISRTRKTDYEEGW
jgi:hypothetical protein